MGVELLTERYKDRIAGVLSCYDRIIVQGTVPGWCYASGMTDYFYKHQIRIFDYPKWAEPLRDKLRANMEQVAADNGLEIEFVRSKKSFRMEDRVLDNAYGWIADFEQAQKLADEFRVEMLHRKLDGFADRYCPVVKQFALNYHWSLDQVEFATDLVFQRQSDWQAIYERLTRTAIHTVKPDNIATFLGRKLNGNYQDEMGNRFHTRIEGTRIKHTMGPVSIKMYDKFRLILRIETTVVNVSFFKHYREVEHKDGTRTMAWAEMKKSIYSLGPLRELLLAANRRYLEFISTIEDDKVGTGKLNKVSQPVEENDRSYRGFNFFDPEDEELFEALGRGEFNITGFQNKDLRLRVKGKNTGQVSRLMKRLRTHGLIKKVGRTYKYYLTGLGKQVTALGLKLKNLHIIPELSLAAAR